MARLICDGIDVAELELADTWRTRTKGLLGRTEITGAMYFAKNASIHTIAMKVPIDVAFVDQDMVVREVQTVKPMSYARTKTRSKNTLEAGAGAFERWNLGVGSKLEFR